MRTAPFRLQVPASSANLGPGFDCLGLALGLYLTIDCQPADRFRVELGGEGAGELPDDDSNLVVRALVAALGADAPPPVRLRLDNAIPLKRGLGSSAAAAVGGLAAGYVLAGARPDRLPATELLRHALGFEGHLDNAAAALLRGLVVSGVEAGKPVTVRLPWPEELRLVAVIPELEIETAKARAALPATIDFDDAVVIVGRTARLLAGLQTGDYSGLRRAFADRLHQPYRLPLAPGLAEALQAMTDCPGSRGAWLSGSGPTLVAIGGDDVDSCGAAGRGVLEARGVRARSRVVAVDRRGASLAPGR